MGLTEDPSVADRPAEIRDGLSLDEQYVPGPVVSDLQPCYLELDVVTLLERLDHAATDLSVICDNVQWNVHLYPPRRGSVAGFLAYHPVVLGTDEFLRARRYGDHGLARRLVSSSIMVPMNGLQGFPVRASELGRRLVDRGPDGLVTLVNGLLAAWSADQSGTRLRLNDLSSLPDGGIDAFAELPRPVGELPHGRIVFQIKWRDVQRKPEKDLWADLGRKVDDEIRALVGGSGITPSAYVLVTNLRLGEAEQRQFLQSRAQLHSGLPEDFFHLWEAARLLSEIQAHPQVAFWVFEAPTAMSVDQAERTMKDRASLRRLPWPSNFVGRDRIKSKISDSVAKGRNAKTVLCGPSGIGSSRLMLEALRPHEGRVVWFDGELPSDQELRHLAGVHAILAFDQPDDLDRLSRIMTASSQNPIVAAVSGAPLVGDLRSLARELPPLSHEEMRDLVRSLEGPHDPPAWRLDFLGESWVQRNAEGRPGLAVALAIAARMGDERDEAEPIRAWIRQLLRGLDPDERKVLTLVAALGPIGARGDKEDELPRALDTFGVPTSGLSKIIAALSDRGLITFHGRLTEVVPGVLADALSAEWLSEREGCVARLVLELENGMERLLALMVRGRASSQAETIARELLTARFPNLASILDAAGEYRKVGTVLPDEAMRHLEWALDEDSTVTTHEPVSSVRSPRGPSGWADHDLSALQELCWLCEGMIFQGIDSTDGTSPGRALKVLAGLAVAAVEQGEPEGQVVGTFAEAMVPHHPEISVALTERSSLLTKLVKDGSQHQRRAALEALLEIFKARDRFFAHLHSQSSTRPPSVVPVAWADVRTYLRKLPPIVVDLLSREDSLHVELLARLAPEAILTFCRFDMINEVAELGRVARERFPLRTDTVDARKAVASALEACLEGDLAEGGDDLSAALAGLAPTDAAPFAERLLWRVSQLTSGERDIAIRDHMAMPNGAWQDLIALATQAAREPTVIPADVVVWVVSDAAFGRQFLALLAKEEAGQGSPPILVDEHLFPADGGSRFRSQAAIQRWSSYVLTWCEYRGDVLETVALITRLFEAGCTEIAAGVIFWSEPGEIGWEEQWAKLKGALSAGAESEASIADVTRRLQFSGWSRELSQENLAVVLGDLLEMGAQPLDVVEVLWAREEALERHSAKVVLAALERWAAKSREPWRLPELLRVDDVIRACAKALPEEFSDWLLATVRRLVEDEVVGLPGGSQAILKSLMDHVRPEVPDVATRILRVVAEASRRDGGIRIGYFPASQALIDPIRDREALLQLAVDEPELLARVLDDVVTPPDSFRATPTAGGTGPDRESMLEAEEDLYFEVLREVAVAAGLHDSIMRTVGEALARLTMSSHTERLASRALGFLRTWEQGEDPRLSVWAGSFRPTYERDLNRQMTWDAETLFWDSNLDLDAARTILERSHDDPKRQWLVRRILKDLPFEEGIRLVDSEDVARALDSTEGLSPARQRMWSLWLRNAHPVS